MKHTLQDSTHLAPGLAARKVLWVGPECPEHRLRAWRRCWPDLQQLQQQRQWQQLLLLTLQEMLLSFLVVVFVMVVVVVVVSVPSEGLLTLTHQLQLEQHVLPPPPPLLLLLLLPLLLCLAVHACPC